jgi:hypothetical protein
MPIVSTVYSPPSYQPSQLNEGKEWTDDDYAKNIRWIVAQGYNQTVSSSYLPYRTDGIDYSFNAQYLRAAQYIYGNQDTSGFSWATKDALNNPTQLPMWKGLDMWSLLTFFNGKCRGRFSPLPKNIQAGGVVGEVLNKKMLKFNVLKRFTDNEAFIKQQEEINGIQLIPDEYLNIHKGQSKQQFFTSFVDEMERAYRNIAKDFLYTNRFLEAFLKAGEYVFIGGRSMIQVYENKGKVYMRVIPPTNQIIDMFKSQEQHQDDQFAGAFEPFSLSECLAQDEFTAEEAADLESISRNNQSWSGYNEMWTNCSWWNFNGGAPQLWRADVQWKSVTYIDGVPVECIREGRLYANKYLKRCRIKPNSISEKYDKSRKIMDFCVFTPMTFFGYNQGICMIVQQILDMKNALITQMHGMYARALGKIPYIDESLLDGVSTPEMLAQAKQTGVIKGNRAETEGEGDIKNRLVENIDFTLSETVQLYQVEIARLERELGNILNMPKESIQGQTKYISEGQLANNQETSQTGTEWLYGGLQNHYLDVIDRATELQLLVASKNKEDLSVVVGDTAAELISNKLVQEMLESSFKIGYNLNNVATVEAKAGLTQMLMQSAPIDPKVPIKYISTLQAETLDELKADFMQYDLEREEKEAAIRKEQQEAALANTQANVQGQTNNTAINAAAGLEKQDMSDDTKLAQDIIAQNQEQPI